MAALAVLRAWAGRAALPLRTLVLVDWADEEAPSGQPAGLVGAAGTFGRRSRRRARADAPAAVKALAENGVEPSEPDGPRAGEAGADRRATSSSTSSRARCWSPSGAAAAAVTGLRRARADAGCRLSRAPLARGHHADGRAPRRRPRGRGDRARGRADRRRRRGGRHGRTIAFEPGAHDRDPGGAALSVDIRHQHAEALAGMHSPASARRSRGSPPGAAASGGEEPVWRIEPSRSTQAWSPSRSGPARKRRGGTCDRRAAPCTTRRRSRGGSPRR